MLDDFYVGSIFDEQTPVILFGTPERWGNLYLTLRLHEITPEALSRVENCLRELLPDEDVVVMTYRDHIHLTYRDTERFRNSVAIASLFMLLITLLGVGGVRCRRDSSPYQGDCHPQGQWGQRRVTSSACCLGIFSGSACLPSWWGLFACLWRFE